MTIRITLISGFVIVTEQLFGQATLKRPPAPQMILYRNKTISGSAYRSPKIWMGATDGSCNE